MDQPPPENEGSPTSTDAPPPSFLDRVFGVIRWFTGPWTAANGTGLLKLIAIILIVKWIFVDLYTIPSGSMEPTLHGDPRFFHGDRVAVNKIVFGPRIPFTTYRIFPLFEPKRWDVVVFHAVEANAPHAILIKRIVGLPGERVHIENGDIYINGAVVQPPARLEDVLEYAQFISASEELVARRFLGWAKEDYIPLGLPPDYPGVASFLEDHASLQAKVQNSDIQSLDFEEVTKLMSDVDPKSLTLITELIDLQLKNRSAFRYGIDEDDEHSLIPEDHYFMLGDNSKNSTDGRYFGWVPRDNLFGRAFAVALPPTRAADLSGFTQTLRGKALLFGIPALVVLYELMRASVLMSWRIRRGVEECGLKRGEHVLIYRAAYGVAVPFSRSVVLGRREVEEGDVVAYLTSDERGGSKGPYFSRVVPGTGPTNTNVFLDAGTENKLEVLGGHGEEMDVRKKLDDVVIIGRVIGVWRPFGERRMFSRGERGATVSSS